MAHMATLNLARDTAARKGCTVSGTYQEGTPYLTINKDGQELGRAKLDSWDGIPCVALHELMLILDPLPNTTTI